MNFSETVRVREDLSFEPWGIMYFLKLWGIMYYYYTLLWLISVLMCSWSLVLVWPPTAFIMSDHLNIHNCNCCLHIWYSTALLLRKCGARLMCSWTWTQHLVQVPGQGLEVMDWWEKGLAHLPKNARRLKATLMIYCAWNIWKARNRRVFDNKILLPVEVLHEIKDEVHCRTVACGRFELSLFNI